MNLKAEGKTGVRLIPIQKNTDKGVDSKSRFPDTCRVGVLKMRRHSNVTHSPDRHTAKIPRTVQLDFPASI